MNAPFHNETSHDEAFLARAIDQSLGSAVADLVVKGGRVFNLVTGALEARDIAICGDRIVGVESGYRGAHEIEAAGKIVVPGFIDTHCHVEVLASDARRVRPLRAAAWRHDGDLGPP